jgi:PAS domain S-box-containing protein
VNPIKESSRFVLRVSVIAFLLIATVAITFVVNTQWREALVLNHFAYLPIGIAAAWWGRRGALIALVPVATLWTMDVIGLTAAPFWTDAVRGVFYLVVGGVIGTLSDSLRGRDDAARASESNLRAVIEASSTGVIVYRDDAVVFANRRVAALLGDDAGVRTSIGRSIWDFVHPEDRPRIQELLQRRASDPQVALRYEHRLLRPDGGMVWCDIASAGVDFDGSPAILVSIYDVTDRHEAEERRLELLRQTREQEDQLVHSTRLAELGEMAAAVAHELNQPLTGIRNFARNATYMLENNAGDTDEVRSNLRLISEQVDRAARIIQQMRSLTRKSDREFVPVDVVGVVREAMDFLSPQFRLSGCEVSLEFGDGQPVVMGDRIRLEQVVLNLLTNARHAMEDSASRHLWIRTRIEPGAMMPVVVEVEDTGKGFAPDDTEKLFRPFYSTKGPGRGTGLGLSISLSIIKEHGGAIEAWGEPGTGARFTIRLPVAPEGSRPIEVTS